jgi:tRNA modification GTPase
VPPLDTDDTIAAISSPPGPALRGLVRLTGPDAWPIALAGFTPDERRPPPTRPEWRRGTLCVDGLRPPLPATIALWPGPATYTGQPLAEIHTVGSAPLLQLLLADRLARGARPAEPGEFTLRAFLSGRIDLTRAEAVLGVIDARTPAQLDAALRQLAGGLAGPIGALKDRLLDTLAHLEAGLDFADEPDVDEMGRASLAADLAESGNALAALADRLRGRDRPEGRPRVVLVGPPNAGKSRLFNALLGRGEAIVSDHAGTTRDYLSAPCDCDGLAVELVDTAGIEPAAGAIEARAQSLRDDQAASADLLLDCSSADASGPPGAVSPDRPRIRVWTKCDVTTPPDGPDLPTSAATGEGLPALRSAIASALRARDSDDDAPAATAARCREGLRRSADALQAASATLTLGGGDELVAVDLRQAIDELGKVVGEVVTDDILDRIFRRFCIGK